MNDFDGLFETFQVFTDQADSLLKNDVTQINVFRQFLNNTKKPSSDKPIRREMVIKFNQNIVDSRLNKPLYCSFKVSIKIVKFFEAFC